MSQCEEEFALFIGGLRRDRKISLLKKKIIQLFKECLGISLFNSDVNVIAPPGARFAFVYLASAEELQHALAKLSNPDTRQDLDFDFEEIENPSRALTVQIKLTKKELLFTQLSNADQRAKMKEELIEGKSLKLNSEILRLSFDRPGPQAHTKRNSVMEKDSEETMTEIRRSANPPPGPQTHTKRNSVVVKGSEETATEIRRSANHQVSVSTHSKSNSHSDKYGNHVKTSTTSLYRFSKTPQRYFNNASTSTTGLIAQDSSSHSLPEKYLIIGQYLGNETRNMEFKRGGGQYVRKQLKEHVAKYVCAFLNSGEGGTLLIGVDDNGAVQGVECNQKQENELRLLIDSVIRGISPQVFPQQYSVTFVPVLELDTEHLTPIAELHVIEIRVESVVGKPDHLYETNRGNVYIRRDGSVQGPLRASDIQEWTRMIHRQEENGRRGELDRLQDEISKYREREEKLAQEHTALKEEMATLHQKKNKKSKTCGIL